GSLRPAMHSWIENLPERPKDCVAMRRRDSRPPARSRLAGQAMRSAYRSSKIRLLIPTVRQTDRLQTHQAPERRRLHRGKTRERGSMRCRELREIHHLQHGEAKED